MDRTVHVFFKQKTLNLNTPEQLTELTKQWLLHENYHYTKVTPQNFEQQNHLTAFVEVVLAPFQQSDSAVERMRQHVKKCAQMLAKQDGVFAAQMPITIYYG